MRLIRLVFVCSLLALIAPIDRLCGTTACGSDSRTTRASGGARTGRACSTRRCRERQHRPHDGVLVEDRAAAAVQSLEPVRRRLPVGRPGRARARRAVPRARVAADDLGHSRTGPTAARARTTPPRSCRTSRRSRAPSRRATAAATRVSIRPLLQRLERAQPGAVPRADLQQARASPWLRFNYAKLYRAAYGGLKAGSPGARSASARRRRAAATSRRRARFRTRSRRRRSRGCCPRRSPG